MRKKTNRKSALKKILCAVVATTMLISPVMPVTAAQYIGKAKAKAIAFADAGVKKSKVKTIKIKLEREDGVKCYDVEFTTSSKKYDYEIKAKNGKILEKKVKNYKTKTTQNGISKTQAKNIALKDAGLKSSQVKFTKVATDTEDGVKVYDIEFRKGAVEYEYEIRATDGKILDKDMDRD